MPDESPSTSAAECPGDAPAALANEHGDEALSLLQRAEAVGRGLLQRLTALHAEVLPAGSGPKRVADHLGQPVPMASRVLKALSESSPLAAMYRLPGPAPLRRWVRAAGRRGADAATLKAANDALDAFEALIATEGGDRSALDAQLVAWLPEARRPLELRRRQAIFRGLSELEGASCTLDLSTMILHPSADGEHVDLCCIQARTGIIALRAGTGIKFVTERVMYSRPERHPLSLEGDELNATAHGARLDAFCDGLPAELEVAHHGDRFQYILRTPGFGPHASADFVLAEVNRAEFSYMEPRASQGGATFFTQLLQLPSRYGVLDVIVHRDLAPTAEPELHLYRNFGEAQACPYDPLREVDRIEPLEDVQRVRGEVADQRLAGFARYGEMLEHVRARLGWDFSDALLYRAQLEYPVPGTQLSLVFPGARF
ncbi:MAG: hypothetical protein R3F49_12675 [Planctomycetota bacterium]